MNLRAKPTEYQAPLIEHQAPPKKKRWMSTNNKPEIHGTDDAIWDRIRLIPFTQRFEGSRSDPELPEKLREELPGVLAWMVEGCLLWQRDGLGVPERVTNATKEYRYEMDSLAAFIEDYCVVHKDASAPFKALYEKYASWCEESNEEPEKKRAFGTLLTERGYLPANGSGNVAIRLGIGLRTDREPPPGDGPGGGHEEGPDVNYGDDQVNYETVTYSDNKTSKPSLGLTNTSGAGDELISLTPETTCKTDKNEEKANQVNVKTTTCESEILHEKRIGNYVNYVNSLTPEAQNDRSSKALEAMRHGNGPPKVIADILEGKQKLPDLAKSVMNYYGAKRFDGWEEWMEPVTEAFEVLASEGAFDVITIEADATEGGAA